MIYIYDILLNFCDNDLIYDFYEWNQNDNIENVKRIKLAHVDKNILDKLLYYNVKLDSDFLIKIYRTCEIYTNKKVKILDYCLLFSDGNRVIAIEFNKDGYPIYKSKLLLDEEDEIAILASNLEKSIIEFELKDKVLEDRFFTRGEVIIRKYLIKEIEDSYNNKNYNKLRYLYQEYFEKDIESYVKMKEELLQSLKQSINDKHKNIYQLLKLTHQKKQV